MGRMLVYCYFAYILCIAFVCYQRQTVDDFDRYIYEAIVRQKHEPWEKVNSTLRHSYLRLQESTVANSDEHMAQIEPFFAIKPLYLALIGFLYQYCHLSPQTAIALISAVSMFAINVILFSWTRRPLFCALVASTRSVTMLGRLGTPDALSTVFVVGAFYALARKRTTIAVLLLLMSVYVRTDNLIVALLVLLWMTLAQKTVNMSHALVLAGIAIASVQFINHFSGNYGWAVLFRFSFLTGATVPSQIPSQVSFREYASVLISGCVQIATLFAPWAILGLAAWRQNTRDYRWLLGIVTTAIGSHFLLFPSSQDRYYAWGYIVVAAIFIESLRNTDCGFTHTTHRDHRLVTNSSPR